MISFLSSSASVLGNKNDVALVQGLIYTITGVYTYLVVAYRWSPSSGNCIVKRLLDKTTGFVLMSCMYVCIITTNMFHWYDCHTISIHTCIVVVVCNISSDVVTKSALARNCIIHPHYPEAELSTVTSLPLCWYLLSWYYVCFYMYIRTVGVLYITITQPLLRNSLLLNYAFMQIFVYLFYYLSAFTCTIKTWLQFIKAVHSYKLNIRQLKYMLKSTALFYHHIILHSQFSIDSTSIQHHWKILPLMMLRISSIWNNPRIKWDWTWKKNITCSK